MDVLSIDFDYFQIVDIPTLTSCYPDGVDLPADLTVLTWCDYYANPKTEKKINAVRINYGELDNAFALLERQDSYIPVMVACSHKHIYDFIVEEMDKQGETDLCVTNIDLHHDMFDNNKEIDCGNWVNHLYKKYDDLEMEWIANPISKKAFDMDRRISSTILSTSISDIWSRSYDMLFICRSDTWLPPHLDKDFDDLLTFVKSNFYNIKCDTQLFKPRDYLDAVERYREATKFFWEQQGKQQ